MMNRLRRASVALFLALVVSTIAYAQTATDAGPASAHSAVTPSDTTTLLDSYNQPYCRALYIEGAGDISITDQLNVTIVYTVPAGTLLPFRPKRVNATGTTATGISCWRS